MIKSLRKFGMHQVWNHTLEYVNLSVLFKSNFVNQSNQKYLAFLLLMILGGWSTVMCPCGVVYSLKFNMRAESPRDYVDILLSW